MKKKMIIMFMLLVALPVTNIMAAKPTTQPTTLPMTTLVTASADVTGDGVSDTVTLSGRKLADGTDSPFRENITLTVTDGKTKKATAVTLKDNAGYNPTVFVGDFTGDKVAEILINIDSGGSGGYLYSYVYSFVGDKPKLLITSQEIADKYPCTVTYKDGYKVEVMCKANRLSYIIDIAWKDSEYLNEIYDKDGKLKKNVEGFLGYVGALAPVDLDADGVFELLALQRISGRFSADGIGDLQNIFKYDKDEFKLFNQTVNISGQER